ncbi:MAG TPA: DEAD/DEAH box helicase, partial [Clostridiales bacterium]|nr:DEAD/DEAH box helicase [Clostridiales bacterium]
MFDQLNLSQDILDALKASGFTAPTQIQSECIPLILEGFDVVGRSQTGSGKTLAFGLPIIERASNQPQTIETLVICPTRELALQVTAELKKIAKSKDLCSVIAVYGGSDIMRQIKALKTAKIVVGTPGRIMDHIERHTLKLRNIKTVVLDEADEMLNMGFREDIESILRHTPKTRQTVMFSATMPLEIKEITKLYMKDPKYVEIGRDNSAIKEIEQHFVKVFKKQKKDALIEFFEKFKPQKTIVFSNTKRMTDELERFLFQKGYRAYALHGDMRQSMRKRVMDSIKASESFILVASDVAARGIDIKDVDYVVNFDIPNDVEYYIHRIGRTGRAGKSGKTLTIIDDKEQLELLKEYIKKTGSTIKELKFSMSVDEYIDLSLTPSQSARLGMGRIISMNKNQSDFNKKQYSQKRARNYRSKKSKIPKPISKANNSPKDETNL